MHVYTYTQGQSPLLLSMPHSGLDLPEDLAQRLTPAARKLPDTDWHIPQLYAFGTELDATIVRASYSRYVVDVNRPPDNQSLYPGQATTGLCPHTDFNGVSLYLDSSEVSETERQQRKETWWQPYHDKLAEELTRIKQEHGYAILYDCHSIASRVPRLFDGELPMLNVGTANSTSCASSIEEKIRGTLAESEISHVINGRFVGGYITRHYGQPEDGIHAIQMEIGQDAYLSDGDGYHYDETRAQYTQNILRKLLSVLLDWKPG